MEKKSLASSAFMALKDGQLEDAIKYYQQYFQANPTDASPLTMAGYCYGKLGKVSEALKHYRHALLISKKQHLTSKIEAIQKAMIRLDPDSVGDFEAELQALPDKQGEETAEIKSLKQTIEKDAKDQETLQQLAQLLEKQQLMGEAAKYYLALGNLFYSAKAFDKAVTLFQHILQIKPTFIHAHIALAETFAKQGSDSDAKKEYLYAAEQLIRNGDLERGKVFAQKAIQLKSIEAHYYLGLVFLQEQNHAEAIQEFETLLKFKVNHQGGLTFLAQLYQQANRSEEATGLYERLLKVDNKNPELLETWAYTAKAQGDTTKACEKFTQAMDAFAGEELWENAAVCATQAIALNSTNQELYLKLADASYNAGLENQAAEACLALAGVLESMGKTDAAAQMRSKAKEITGGEVNQETPPAQEAPPPLSSMPPEEEPPLAPTLEPESVPAPAPPAPVTPVDSETNMQMMMNIAGTYIQQGSLDEAIEIYQKILKTDPQNETVKSALTRVYAMFAGINPETAVARKSNHQEREIDDQQVQREAREKAQHEAKIRSQRLSGKESAAATKNENSKAGGFQTLGHDKEDEIDGDSQDEFMTVTVAEIYTKQGLLNEALKIYQKILEIEPGNQEAKLKKEELESKMAEQERVRKQSEVALQEKNAADKKAAEAKVAAEKKALEEKAAAEQKAKAQKTESAGKTDQSSKPSQSKSSDDDQEPPPKRRGRVSYV